MMLVRSVIIVLLGLCTCYGQNAEDYNEGNDQSVVSVQKSKDVSILKQIHRHNEDGSYTYGYEGSDGSFKIETKTVTGEVTGKYGYVDDSGKLRVVEYGANKYGFQPSGEGITVPSPTLVELRPDQDERDEEPPVPAKRPSSTKPTTKPLFRNNNNRPESDVGLYGSQQKQQQPLQSQSISVASDFDDGEWTAPPAPRQQQTAPSRRPSATATRPNKSVPPVSGSFMAVPVEQSSELGPSASYQSVQDFGDRRLTTGNGRSAHTSTVDHSYQTFEEHQEPLTEPPTLNQAVAKPTARRTGTASSASKPVASKLSNSYRTAPRQMRTSGVLDQLAEQYALPESRSPVSHDFSFGSDS
ncbi:uncharacterized protein LOC112597741 isoform X2 [Melanaphis sacchari]|uniref:uncharacterized protein LOC112597741 isoform X2 n=1 Tax=Melanaphis sacchari TaxID=742174 RepID=UPI000DC132A5|nr:uncharacterized protein LOC112597741 isoform X2 [Melanaphis sacchari]